VTAADRISELRPSDSYSFDISTRWTGTEDCGFRCRAFQRSAWSPDGKFLIVAKSNRPSKAECDSRVLPLVPVRGGEPRRRSLVYSAGTSINDYSLWRVDVASASAQAKRLEIASEGAFFPLRCTERPPARAAKSATRTFGKWRSQVNRNRFLFPASRLQCSVLPRRPTHRVRETLVRLTTSAIGRVVERLARVLRSAFPGMQRLSPRNLGYMKAFAEAWPDARILQQLVAKLPWITSGSWNR
jgi:hypothetical protein